MKLISKLILCVFVAASTLFFTSCNESNNNLPADPQHVVFATLTALTSDGCTFTTSKEDDSAIITYTCTQKLSEKDVTVGNRYIISFTNGTQDKYKSGEINLMNCIVIYNAKPEYTTLEEISKFTTSPIRVTLLTRTGTYFNIESVVPLEKQPKRFNIYFDKATLDDEMPHAVVSFQSDNINAREVYYFGSFDISSVWNRPTCKGIRLTYTNRSGETVTDTFTKGAQSIRPNS